MYLICRTQDIPENQAMRFTTPHGDIVISQRAGSFYAYQDICPHLHISLGQARGALIKQVYDYIVCATHGAWFNVADGHCVKGPCEGAALHRVAIEIHSDGGVYLKQQRVTE